MAKVQAGVVTQADLNMGTNTLMGKYNGPTSTPATWTYVWFAAAVLFILVSYFGFGGLRGSVAS